jgi:hypothetical protein
MNDFPRMIYKAGGAEEIHGGRFSTLIAHDADELESALSSGWALTTPEAVEAAKPPAAVPDDSTPPTRDEIERKATELGIKFDGRTSDKKLRYMIAATLED